MNIAFGTQKGVSANASGAAGFCSMRMGWLFVEVALSDSRGRHDLIEQDVTVLEC